MSEINTNNVNTEVSIGYTMDTEDVNNTETTNEIVNEDSGELYLTDVLTDRIKDMTEEEIEKFKSLEYKKNYWFIVGSRAYYGTYEKEDRFIAKNITLTSTMKNGKTTLWSININKVFNTKEECIEYMKEEYGEDYNDLKFEE